MCHNVFELSYKFQVDISSDSRDNDKIIKQCSFEKVAFKV